MELADDNPELAVIFDIFFLINIVENKFDTLSNRFELFRASFLLEIIYLARS